MKKWRQKRSISSIENGTALRALVAVADEGSFRRAAERLGYTQSAISHQIAALEEGLGAAALPPPRRPRGGDADAGRARSPTTTPAARSRRCETLDVEVRAAQRGERETLRVGVFQTAAAELVPPALRVLGERHPGRRGRAGRERAPRATSSRGSTSGRLDLAYALNPAPHDTIESIPLMRGPLGDPDLARQPARGRAAPERSTCSTASRSSPGASTGGRRSSSRSSGAGAASRRASSTAPTTTSRCSGSSPRGLGHACVGRLVAQRADRAGADLAASARGAAGAHRSRSATRAGAG